MASPPDDAPALLVAGKLVVDEVLVCDAPPVAGSAQRARERLVTGGGQVWHTARAAARAGATVAVTGWCGGDADSARLRGELVAAGIADHLATHDPASRSTVLVHGGDRIVVSHGSSGYVDPRAIPGTALDGLALLHLDAYVLDAVAGDALVALASAAAARGLPITLEAPRVDKCASSAAWLALLPPLRAVLGRPDEIAAVSRYLAAPPSITVAHDQDRPVITQHGSSQITTPVPQVEVASLGAGDRFAGGWLAARLRGADLADAAAAGIAAAGLREAGPLD
ncbi:MAG: PfkB family carbohydrate kinase [bacterium]